MRNIEFNYYFTRYGGAVYSDTSAHTGHFIGIYAHTTTVIGSITCALWGSPSSVTIPAGSFFEFPGGATSVTAASGQFTLINAN